MLHCCLLISIFSTGLLAIKEDMKPFLIQLKSIDVPQFQPKGRIAIQEQADMHAENIINTLSEHSKTSQKKLLEFLNSEKLKSNVDYIKTYYISNTISVVCNTETINKIKAMEEVEEVISNKKVKLNMHSDSATNALHDVEWKGDQIHWSVKFINATNLHPRVYEMSKSLVYANAGKNTFKLDTGVEYKHPALYKNYIGYREDGKDVHDYSWWDGNKVPLKDKNNTACGVDVKYPCGDHDHGTHTMSTTVGLLGLGVSPKTKWMACKNMDNGYGSPESYLSCLNFFLAPTDLRGLNPDTSLRPHVVGNSYGCPSDEGCNKATFKNALLALKSVGIFMSVSAGNDGRNGCKSILSPPASDPNSFSVAASKYNSFERADFSSLGPVDSRSPAIDVTAPGVNITGAALGGKYISIQGTSMASPHVSGAALLVMAGCPHLYRRVDKVAEILRLSSTPVEPKLMCGKDKKASVPNNVIIIILGIWIWCN